MPWRLEAMKDVEWVRNASGSSQSSFDPKMSEWGNLAGRKSAAPKGEQTGGSETSQYPEEEKSNEIPTVAVSELGTA